MLWWLLGIALIMSALAYSVARVRRTASPTRRRPVPKAPPSRSKPAVRPVDTRPATTTGPAPGEIWWADVPYEDGSGHKVRPCLVVRSHRTTIEVLKITSQDQRHRQDHIEIATRHWDADAEHNSFLDLTDPITVVASAFDNRAGVLDAPTWQRVRQLHRL
jgi:hypothetical protein